MYCIRGPARSPPQPQASSTARRGALRRNATAATSSPIPAATASTARATGSSTGVTAAGAPVAVPAVADSEVATRPSSRMPVASEVPAADTPGAPVAAAAAVANGPGSSNDYSGFNMTASGSTMTIPVTVSAGAHTVVIDCGNFLDATHTGTITLTASFADSSATPDVLALPTSTGLEYFRRHTYTLSVGAATTFNLTFTASAGNTTAPFYMFTALT